MRVAIISSKNDPASSNMKQNLIENFGFKKINGMFDSNEVYGLESIRIYTLNIKHIFADDLDKEINAELFIICSTHRSESNKPAMTVHSIGNFNKAEHGGKDRTICPTNALFIRNYLIELKKHAHEVYGYDLTMEATHHGPYIEKPIVYVEIGATEKEWNDRNAGRIAAKCIMSGIEKLKEKHGYKIAAGIGGLHYCDNFNRLIMKSDLAFVYICPKYSIKHLNLEMLQQMKDKGNVELFVLDWKGLGQDKQFLLDLLEKSEVEWKRNDKVD